MDDLRGGFPVQHGRKYSAVKVPQKRRITNELQNCNFSDKAPKAIGPNSPAVCIDGLVLFSGMLPVDPATGVLAGADITAQTKQSLDNICAVLEEAELTLDHVVRITVFLADIKDFAAMNAVYGAYFKAPYPARSCFQVAALPMGAKIEIEVTCARGTIPANE